MSQIRLVADSSCDLLSLDGVDFVSVPLTLRTETEEFRDDARLDVDAMVATLRATKGRSYKVIAQKNAARESSCAAFSFGWAIRFSCAAGKPHPGSGR